MQVHPLISVNDVAHYLTSWTSNLDDNIWHDLIELIKTSQAENPYHASKTATPGKNRELDYSLMWMEQTGINFPVMYVASVYLYLYGQQKGCDTFLFATRDCCHWVKIFKRLFPDAHAHYFHCSRNMLENGYETHNPYYKKYVESLIHTSVEKTIFVDIHGTCQRAFTYFDREFKQTPYCFLLSSSYRAYAEFPSICLKNHEKGKLLNVVFDARGTPIEMLNFDVQGTLQDYNQNGPVRDPPEYSVKRLEPYHICINNLVSKMKPWRDVIPRKLRKQLKIVDFEELSLLVRRIYRVIQDNKPILLDYIKHPGKH